MNNKTKILYKRLNVYRYKDGDEFPLCIFLCNTDYSNTICIIPLVPEPIDNNSVKLTTLNQYANVSGTKEIKTTDLANQLYLNSKPVRISQTEFTEIYHKWLDTNIETFSAATNNAITSLDLFETTYKFITWQLRKYILSTDTFNSNTTIYENAIYWTDIGFNVGSELNKRRPVLIWKKRINTKNRSSCSYIVIPISSKQKHKKYYMNVPILINDKQCYLRIEDMKRINIRRIIGPTVDSNHSLIFIDDNTREEIKKAITNFYIFDNKYKKS